ncbi:hypothetical protein EYF80_002245 [Liparis tanakae]|uniref:Uncharacterized protein n=1 Tax=Liparis tanakae TaxID=230148 RepID=A0A4Z2JD09_9TELE|nr:hypothetical protein EYF80_002245 [Liparis tanakae]
MGPFHTSGITGLQHTINMDGRDEFIEDNECCSNNSQEVHEQDSISEDSDSDLDNHGEDSSSNTSADDHMTTKRTQCRLQGAGVKEVRDGAPCLVIDVLFVCLTIFCLAFNRFGAGDVSNVLHVLKTLDLNRSRGREKRCEREREREREREK